MPWVVSTGENNLQHFDDVSREPFDNGSGMVLLGDAGGSPPQSSYSHGKGVQGGGGCQFPYQIHFRM